jgi:hypothetical protein
MSNVYWKNVLNQSIDESELLKDFEQLSFKIDDYYKSYSLSEDVSDLASIVRNQSKGLTTVMRRTTPKSKTQKRPSSKGKSSSRTQENLRHSFHQRTQTLQISGDSSRRSYPHSRKSSAFQSKQALSREL